MKALLASLCLFVGSVLVVPVWAADDSLADARLRQQEEAVLNREVAFTNEVCGTTLTATIAWDRTTGWVDKGRGIAKACDGALGAIEAMCRTSKKAAVQSKIRKFECAGDGAGPDLSGATLKFGATEGHNGFDETKAYLDGRL